MAAVSKARAALAEALANPSLLEHLGAPCSVVEDAATGLDLEALLQVANAEFPPLFEATLAVAVEEGEDALLDACAAALGVRARRDSETVLGILSVLGFAAAVTLEGETLARRAQRRERCRQIVAPWTAHRGKAVRGAAAVARARCGERSVLDPVITGKLKIPIDDRIRIVGLVGDMSSWVPLVDLAGGMPGPKYLHLADAVDGLGDRVGLTVEVAEEMYAGIMASLNRLGRASILVSLLGGLARFCPLVYRRHMRRWVAGTELGPLEAAALSLRHASAFDPRPLLLRLAAPHQDVDTINSALDSLLQVDAAMAGRAALKLLDHWSWRVRQAALWAIGTHNDPAYLGVLLRATGDIDNDVRETALGYAFKHDDPRVTTAVLAGLNDPEQNVRRLSQCLLAFDPERWRKHAWYRETTDEAPWWQPLMDELAAIVAWGEQIGRELLGCNVRIVQLRQGLGRTLIKRQLGTVDIEISDVPLLSGHPHGGDVMRGLILHEIGHHLYDIGRRGQRTMGGIASAEGVRIIFDILIDEQLERRLRSRNPRWGVWLDRLASYAFAQERQTVTVAALAEVVGQDAEAALAAVQAGTLPGRVERGDGPAAERLVTLTGVEMRALPGLFPPLLLFLHQLRCPADGDRCPSPQVTAALQAVPRDLRDLDHAGVLNAARAVAAVLGRDKRHRGDLRRLRRWLEQQRREWEALQALLDRLEDAGINPDELLGPAAKAEDDEDARAPVSDFARRSRFSRHLDAPRRGGRRWRYNTRPGEEFARLREEVTLPRDAAAQAALARTVARHVRVLRPYLERLGLGEEVEGGQRRGRRLDRPTVAGALVRGSPDLFVNRRQVLRADCYIGVLIDRSGSMASDGKLDRAMAFGALVAESAARAPGVTGHLNAFDDKRFIRLGTFRNHAVASLDADDGNNDSGGLLRAAELAQASGRRRRLLVMISDGLPTECTMESLKALVRHLTQVEGIICAQVAVDKVPEVAFPHFVDLSESSFDEAVARFGRLLVSLTSSWR